MKKKSIKLISLFAVSAAFGFSLQASDNQLARTLVEKGLLTETEAKAATSGNKMSVKPASVSVAAGSPQTQMLTFSGLLQTQYTFATVRDRNPGTRNPSNNNNFLIPHARLGLKADLPNDWSGYIDIDVGSAATNAGPVANVIEQMYIKKSFEMANVSAAYQKVPFGYEFMTNVSKIKPIYRSIVTQYFTAPAVPAGVGGSTLTGAVFTGSTSNVGFGGRHLGAYADGKYEGFGWTVAITNGYQGLGNPSATNRNELGYYGGVSYEGEWEEFMFAAGINIGYQPEGNTGWINSITKNSVFGFNPYATVNWQDFRVMVELLGASIQKGRLPTTAQAVAGTAPKTATPYGITVTPSYMFNEEWEGVFRFAYLDSDQRGINIANTMFNTPTTNVPAAGSTGAGQAANLYREAATFYLGVNYYIMGNDVKLSAGYEYGKFIKLYNATAATTAGTPAASFSKRKAYAHNVSLRLQLLM